MNEYQNNQQIRFKTSSDYGINSLNSISQQNCQIEAPKQQCLQQSSCIENFSNLKPNNQNSFNGNQQAQNRLQQFEIKKDFNLFKVQCPIIPLNIDNVQKMVKLKNNELKFTPNNFNQINQLPINQQQRQNNLLFQPQNNYDCGNMMNLQQFTPQIQQNPKIKIIWKVQQNPNVIEIENKKQIVNDQAPQSNPPIERDENLFKRQLPTPKEKPKEETPYIDQQLFQRTYPQKNNNKSQKDINDNGNQWLQQNTIFKTAIINCFYCKTLILNSSIQLICQHVYHQGCFEETIYSQIFEGKSVCHCLCKKKIPQKLLLENLTKDKKDILFTNQINEILQKYGKQIL